MFFNKTTGTFLHVFNDEIIFHTKCKTNLSKIYTCQLYTDILWDCGLMSIISHLHKYTS